MYKFITNGYNYPSSFKSQGLENWKSDVRLTLKPWTFYWLRRDILHRTPPAEACSSPKLMLRWFLK
jgi:hypothetical protein